MPKNLNIHQITKNEPPQTSLPQTTDPNRLVRLPEVLTIIPVAPATWWLWVSQGKAPPAIRLGRCTCWRYADVIAMTKVDEVPQG